MSAAACSTYAVIAAGGALPKDTRAASDPQSDLLPAPALTEAKSRWLASRLGRGAQRQPTADNQPDAGPAAPPASVAVGVAVDGRERRATHSAERPAPDQTLEGASPPAHSNPRSPFGDAAVQGDTRAERIEALTGWPAGGSPGEDGAQPVTLISAVQTFDGRLLMDSVARGAAEGFETLNVPLPNRTAIADVNGASVSAGGGNVRRQNSGRRSIEMAGQPRGFRRLFAWRSPSLEASDQDNDLPADVP